MKLSDDISRGYRLVNAGSPQGKTESESCITEYLLIVESV
jgi:hypothetical protein